MLTLYKNTGKILAIKILLEKCVMHENIWINILLTCMLNENFLPIGEDFELIEGFFTTIWVSSLSTGDILLD